MVVVVGGFALKIVEDDFRVLLGLIDGERFKSSCCEIVAELLV